MVGIFCVFIPCCHLEVSHLGTPFTVFVWALYGVLGPCPSVLPGNEAAGSAFLCLQTSYTCFKSLVLNWQMLELGATQQFGATGPKAQMRVKRRSFHAPKLMHKVS